jgi:hypothetical protein
VWEIHRHGSVRGVEAGAMVRSRGTLETESPEQQRTQTVPKEQGHTTATRPILRRQAAYTALLGPYRDLPPLLPRQTNPIRPCAERLAGREDRYRLVPFSRREDRAFEGGPLHRLPHRARSSVRRRCSGMLAAVRGHRTWRFR